MSVDVNYLTVLIAAIVSMIIGFLWYGPLFGKKWLALSSISIDKAVQNANSPSMKKNYILMFIGSLLTAYVFYHFLAYASSFTGESGASSGISGGFYAWLGFIAPVILGKVLWEGKSWTLWTIESGYYLVTLLINGAILASWM